MDKMVSFLAVILGLQHCVQGASFVHLSLLSGVKADLAHKTAVELTPSACRAKGKMSVEGSTMGRLLPAVPFQRLL